jgi:hypothetical protein
VFERSHIDPVCVPVPNGQFRICDTSEAVVPPFSVNWMRVAIVLANGPAA